MKKNLLGIIIGVLFFETSIYAATTYFYTSNEVSYTPSDTSWNVSTVKAAIDDLKSTSGTALTDLKNTNIAKAVNANGDTLSSVIDKLATIQNRGYLNHGMNPLETYSLPAGYYSGGTISSNPKSLTFTPTVYSSSIDMGSDNMYRYVNMSNIYNQGYNTGYRPLGGIIELFELVTLEEYSTFNPTWRITVIDTATLNVNYYYLSLNGTRSACFSLTCAYVEYSGTVDPNWYSLRIVPFKPARHMSSIYNWQKYEAHIIGDDLYIFSDCSYTCK